MHARKNLHVRSLSSLLDLSLQARSAGIYSQKRVSYKCMKRLPSALLLPLLSLGLMASLSAEPGNVRINFVQPEKFSDFRIKGRQENVSADIFRDQVSSYLSAAVAKRFPGDTLNLTFTDIDLAGRIDFSKTRRLSNIPID